MTLCDRRVLGVVEDASGHDRHEHIASVSFEYIRYSVKFYYSAQHCLTLTIEREINIIWRATLYLSLSGNGILALTGILESQQRMSGS